LAQVHKATLPDGSAVAVKVQHPYVQGNARIDMKTMEYLVKIMGWVFPEFKFQWLVDETKKNIPQELNFEQEGHNAEKIAKMFEHIKWLHVPKVRWDLTTSRVLTMDFINGGQVNDLEYIKEHKINPFEVSDKLGRLYSQMIFINGFVHSDPHPGNIFVRKSERGDCDIILLDHGLYAVSLIHKIKKRHAFFNNFYSEFE
jgi:aarF domain-containing kinase